MATIELELDELTLERARQMAEARKVTVNDLVKEALERFQPAAPDADPTTVPNGDSIIGMFADCPEAVDEMLADVMESRRTAKWRVE